VEGLAAFAGRVRSHAVPLITLPRSWKRRAHLRQPDRLRAVRCSSPFYAKIRPERNSSRSVIAIEQSAEAALATDRPIAVGETGIRHDQHVADTLMVSLTVIMGNEFVGAVNCMCEKLTCNCVSVVPTG
jgi:hypothetical protein